MNSPIDFVQINLKKSFIATVELNKTVKNLDNYIILASETYNFKGKVRSSPPKSNIISSDNGRAAIISSPDLKLIKLEKLMSRDCAVGLLQTGKEKVLIASIYLDITLSTVQTWLTDLVDFATNKGYPLLLGMDSNAHSVLYGHETNQRGEELEEFIINNYFYVENTGLTPTFEARRTNGQVASIIDVTLSRGLRNSVSNWRVDTSFNGSDHNTILFQYLSLIHI